MNTPAPDLHTHEVPHGARRGVVITRPQPQCDAWVAALQAQDWPALAYPLLEIAPSPEPERVRQVVQQCLAARPGWPGQAHQAPCIALMLVSGAAFEGLAQVLGPVLLGELIGQANDGEGGLRFWVTGPGTAQVLMAAGVAPWAIDRPPGRESSKQTQQAGEPGEQAEAATAAGLFDSQALWAQVKTQIPGNGGAGASVLLVRGANDQGQYEGNPWLAQQLQQAGVQVLSVLAYQRQAPQATAQRQAVWDKAIAAQSIWVLSSSQGLRYLPQHDWSGTDALATHPRIADKCREQGFVRVRVCEPQWAAVLASLKSWYD